MVEQQHQVRQGNALFITKLDAADDSESSLSNASRLQSAS